jgi:hypothetical protein
VEPPPWLEDDPRLTFIASIDCAALPGDVLDIALPKDGTLLFFMVFDLDGEDDGDWVVLDARECARVIHVPAGTLLERRPTPTGIRTFPEADLVATVASSPPGREHPLMYSTRLADGTSLYDAVDDPFLYIQVEEQADAQAGLTWWGHRIGGFSSPWQDAVEYEVARTVIESAEDHRRFGASPAEVDRQNAVLLAAYGHPEDLDRVSMGGDTEYPEPTLDEETSRWTLLLEIRETADLDWSSGALYWMIRRDDLAAGRFDTTRLIYQR